ncbi:hypothetical protein VTN77DRAFT_7050 [Rasamsonia byssochlamydoides]|uniref:uncharacterized protein n=1 Tax=Rasamsonia byssochlamydoides TaxID=89139 RepID=UPI0037444BC0
MAKATNLARMSWERVALPPTTGLVTQQDTQRTLLPVLIYGTAWKKDRTTDLVYKALRAGFRAVDTAAQPKHYREDLVGAGIRRAIREGIVRREDLYIQTKFTSVQGQDTDNMPYDPRSSISEQAHASIKSSLHNLRLSEKEEETNETTYIDTLVLHSPLPTIDQTLEAWSTVESYMPHRIRNLGISNCPLPVLEALYSSPRVKVKPAVVQNRFYPATRYDGPLRAFCRQHGIIYQSFWTLTANPNLLSSSPVAALARQTGISPPAALYSLVLGLGNTTVLDGTTNEAHMVDDLAALETMKQFAGDQPDQWQRLVGEFKQLIHEPA